jgi:hypothetical protein
MTEKHLPPDAPLARRTILKGATLGVGAGLVSTLRFAQRVEAIRPALTSRSAADLPLDRL